MSESKSAQSQVQHNGLREKNPTVRKLDGDLQFLKIASFRKILNCMSTMIKMVKPNLFPSSSKLSAKCTSSLPCRWTVCPAPVKSRQMAANTVFISWIVKFRKSNLLLQENNHSKDFKQSWMKILDSVPFSPVSWNSYPFGSPEFPELEYDHGTLLFPSKLFITSSELQCLLCSCRSQQVFLRLQTTLLALAVIVDEIWHFVLVT